MTVSEKQKLKWFIAVLAIAALFINYLFYSHEKTSSVFARPQKPQGAANVAVMPTASSGTANSSSQYFDTAFVKPNGFKVIALSIATENGKKERAVQDILVSHFDSGTVKIIPTFFKPAFVEKGQFENAFNDTGDVPSKLELGKYLDGIMLVRHHLEFSQSGADLENVITATIRLDIAVIPIVDAVKSQTRTFTVNGAGFSRPEAQARAEERLIKQIADDTKMSLN